MACWASGQATTLSRWSHQFDSGTGYQLCSNGRVWFNAPVLKTGISKGILGSNPNCCAREHYMREVFSFLLPPIEVNKKGNMAS